VNENLRLKNKEEERIMKQRREEKKTREEGWENLVGADAVEEGGVTNQEGFDEDDFM